MQIVAPLRGGLAAIPLRLRHLLNPDFRSAHRPAGWMDRRLVPGRRQRAALTTGELRRIVLSTQRHADALERLMHALFALGRGHPAIGERKFDILIHGRSPIRLNAWKINPISRLRMRARSDILRPRTGRSFNERAVRRGIEQPEDRQERRLAAAGWAGDRDIPPRFSSM